MVYSVLALLVLVACGVIALQVSQSARIRRFALERVGLQVQDNSGFAGAIVLDQSAPRVYPPRYRFCAPLAGVLTGAAIYFLSPLPVPYSFAFAILAAVIISLLESIWYDSRIQRIETQLADAIDLMVAALRAGSALLSALEAAVREAKQPIRGELESLLGRIRLGEDPRTAVRDLSLRVPLESFRLFSHCLLVHWETGGSLASSLRTVSRTVRDRIEVARRISSQAVESQISVVAVMAISYGLTFLMFKTNPPPIHKLIFSEIGAYTAAIVILLQAAGIVWISRMSRIRF